MIGVRSRLLSSPLAVLLSLTLLALLVPLLRAEPARALTVECGSALFGVDSDYATPKSNGHPEDEWPLPDSGLDGWSGSPAVRDLKIALFALERTDALLDATINLLDTFLDTVPGKTVQVITKLTQTLLHIVMQVLESVILAREQKNEDVDACSGALLGDLIDLMFITTMEEDLAQLDLNGMNSQDSSVQASARRPVPSAMYLLPQDGWPAWHESSSLYSGLPGHPNPDVYYVDGALNGDYIGVAVTVRNEIAYLEASGIDTGTTETIPDGNGGQVTVYGAKDLWMQAMQLMAQGQLRQAHTRFAQAYQTAVSQHPHPGASYPPASGDGSAGPPPPPNPWG